MYIRQRIDYRYILTYIPIRFALPLKKSGTSMFTPSTAQTMRRLAASASFVLLALPFAAITAHATDLVVSAAASLTNAFKDLGTAFEQQNPGVKVINNFGASDILMQQIVRGAPADVFASADQTVLIVPNDSTLPLTNLKDLTQASVKKVALGNPASVTFGRYTKAALEHAGLWDAVLAKGVMAQNVRQSLDYVTRGEVEAGFVFATDAAVMPDKVKVAIRIPSDTPATYPIAVTTNTAQAELANKYLTYVQSAAGQAVLARYGFLKP